MRDAASSAADGAPSWIRFLQREGLRWPPSLQLSPEQRPAALCFVEDDGKVLLLQRNYPPFRNLWVAPGGKLLPDEAPDAAARREVYEETGLHVEDLRFRMMVAEAGPSAYSNWLLFVFTAQRAAGSLRAGDEGELAWFERKRLATVGMSPVDLLLQEYIFSSDPPCWVDVAFDERSRVRRLSVHSFP